MTQAANTNQAIRDELLYTLANGTREERNQAKAGLAQLNASMIATAKAAHKAKIEADDQTKAEAAQQKKDNQMKATALRQWVLGGGRRAEFEARWPQMKAELLKRQTIEAMNRPHTLRF